MRSFQYIRHYSILSLVFIVFLTIATSLFAYQVSPLRDPSFQPDSGNAGSLISWMQKVTEEDWLSLANVIAFSFSTNFTLVFWQERKLQQIGKGLGFIIMTVVWSTLLGAFKFLSVIYLLTQWLID